MKTCLSFDAQPYGSFALLVRHLKITRLLFFLLLAGWCLPYSSPATIATGVPAGQIGLQTAKKHTGDNVGIFIDEDGVNLKARTQSLQGGVNSQGLWLQSTVDESGADKVQRFSLCAVGFGRKELSTLPTFGEVKVEEDVASWVREGLIEEYRASTDGLRQDFVVLNRPSGDGDLVVALELKGAEASEADYGAKLRLHGCGRELAYHRLLVTDASGRTLPARMEVVDLSRMVLSVEDKDALYPVRIDPTFSDADWVYVGGPDGVVHDIIYDGNGNLYIGGAFANVSGTNAFAGGVAKWNGSTWSTFGTNGTGGLVRALAIFQGKIYAGGSMNKGIVMWDGANWIVPGGDGVGIGQGSGGVEAMVVSGNYLYVAGILNLDGNFGLAARWDGTTWESLSSEMPTPKAMVKDSNGNVYIGGSDGVTKWDGTEWAKIDSNGLISGVHALAIDGNNNLYVGGSFDGGIARWESSSGNWTIPFQGGLPAAANDFVDDIALSGNKLYIAGKFAQVGGVAANNIAMWDGVKWSGLGSGTDGWIEAIAISSNGSELFAGGEFSKAGNKNAPFLARLNLGQSGPSAPAITSAPSANGTVGSAFSYQITASNNATSFGATGLPGGLTVNTTTGLISGTPSVVGNSSVTLTATNAIGTGNVTLTIFIAAAPVSSMVTVQGGTLVTSNGLNGTVVSTFQIGKYEVTWAKWQEVRGWAVENGYTDLANIGAGSAHDHPVRSVSWYDVLKWMNAKSEKEGLMPAYSVNGTVYRSGEFGSNSNVIVRDLTANGYRLPSEAEWEWAARGGVWGQGYTYSGSNNADSVAWTRENSSGAAENLEGSNDGRGTWPVGQKAANELGIYDMSGNVWEWCEDLDGTFYNEYRRIRGGSWENIAAGGAAVAFRTYYGASTQQRSSHIGFRLARSSGSVPSVPAITSATSANGTVGVPFSYQITASNGPSSFGASSLPPGLSLNASTGLISGTPSVAGNSSVTLTATNAIGTGNVTLTIFIAAAPVSSMVTVQGGTLVTSNGLNGTVVSTFQIGKYEVTWAKWQEVRDWAVNNGYADLAGVGYGSAGDHPVRYVNWSDVVKYCNARSEWEGLVPVYRVAGAVYRSGQSRPDLQSGANGYRLPSDAEWEWAARGGISSRGYTYSGSNDPNAVAWTYENSSDGTKAVGTKAANELGIYDMSGNVQEWCEDLLEGSGRRIRGGHWKYYANDAAVVIRERSDFDWFNRRDTDGFRVARSLGSVSSVPAITSATSANGTVGVPFSYQITASNNATSFGATGLPGGLTVNTATGLISGTPSASGNFSVALSATNSGGTGNATLLLTIAPAPIPPPVITSPSTADGTVGSAFSYQITASNNATSFGATGLPGGLTVNTATGLISGTPTVSGNFSVTISATNSGGTGNATVLLSIASAPLSAPAITSSASANGTVGSAFSYQITASNNATSFGATGLPAGLMVNTATGLISGTPTASGNFIVALTATNISGTVTAPLKLVIEEKVPALTGDFIGNSVSSLKGQVSIRIVKGTSFSGSLVSTAGRTRLRGKLDSQGKGAISIPTLGTLNLELKTQGLGDGVWDAQDSVYLAAVLKTNGEEIPLELRPAARKGGSAAPLAGSRINALLESSGKSNFVFGHGFAGVAVGKAGAVRFTGSLADGTRISGSARMVEDGEGGWKLPVALPLASVKGFLHGEAAIVSSPGAGEFHLASSAPWTWTRPANPKAKSFAAGFQEELDVKGRVWSWIKGNSVLGGAGGNFTLALSFGDNSGEFVPAAGLENLQGRLGADNKPVWSAGPPPKGFTMRITPATGQFSGKIPGTRNGKSAVVSYQGMLFPSNMPIGADGSARGAGFVSGSNSANQVLLVVP